MNIRSQKHERMRHEATMESYFENFLYLICGVSVETQRKLVSAVVTGSNPSRNNFL